jgi:molybdopterin-guanine dinucleotide biosynthesis protein A
MAHRVPVYILAGGASRRFGSDKALATLNGMALLRHVSQSVSACASRITVVAATAGKYQALGLHTIGDARPGQGPVGGLQAALADLRGGNEPQLLLTSCDLLGLRPSWLELLVAKAQAGNYRALAYADTARVEPLPAIFHRDLSLLVDTLLAGPERTGLKDVLRVAGTCLLPRPADWDEATNINRLDDLERFCQSRLLTGKGPAG